MLPELIKKLAETTFCGYPVNVWMRGDYGKAFETFFGTYSKVKPWRLHDMKCERIS